MFVTICLSDRVAVRRVWFVVVVRRCLVWRGVLDGLRFLAVYSMFWMELLI